jgi:predicted nucleic acid-binding protein
VSQPVAWVEAGRRFARYAKRRRRSAGQGTKRLLADFIIGSLALAHADRFMTLDPRRYARDFPELKLV